MMPRRVLMYACLILMLSLLTISDPPTQRIAKAQAVVDIGWPFPPCETWYVLQGYFSAPPWSHQGAYAFDLLKGDPNNDAQTGNATIIAPMSGRIISIYAIQGGAFGWGLIIENGPYRFYLNHLQNPTHLRIGQQVAKGDFIGRVLDQKLGGWKHLDIALHIHGQNQPLDIAGTVWRFPGANPLPPVEQRGRGTWAGTRLTSHCPPNLPPNAPILTGPADSATITARQVTLTWQDGGDPDNGPRPSRDYFAEIWSPATGWRAELPWTFNTNWVVNLPADGAYAWRVRSGDGTGATWSEARTFTITTIPPAAPDNLRFVRRTPTSLTISWRDAAGNETAYRVYRWNGTTRTWVRLKTLPPNTTSFTDTGLNYRFGYSYYVAAVNAAGERRSAGTVRGFIAVAPNDANNDGFSDIFWRHMGNGRNVVHLMRSFTLLSNPSLGVLSDQNWKIVASGDFNGDGHADLLLRHAVTGHNVIYFIRNGSISATGTVNVISNLNWRVAGVADFNNDGRADILWRHAQTGANVIYLMQGTRIIQSARINIISDPNWQISGLGDFNADGRADILWRHATSGHNVVHFIDGTRVTGRGAINVVSDRNWRIVGVADFNADGRADILWRNAQTGANSIFFMNGATRMSTGQLQRVSDRNWRIVGAGDYNGDGFADILWRQSQTGVNIIHLMRGDQLLRQARIQTVADRAWQVVGTGSNVATGVGPIRPLADMNLVDESEITEIAPHDAEAVPPDHTDAGAVPPMEIAESGELPPMEGAESADNAPMEWEDGADLAGPNGEPIGNPHEGEALLVEPDAADLPDELSPGSVDAQPWQIHLPFLQR